MPDPRHGGYGLGFAVHLAPLFLLANVVYMTAMLLVMMGIGGLVTRANVGAFQRMYSLGTLPWIGIAAWALHGGTIRRKGPRPSSAAPAAPATRETAGV